MDDFPPQAQATNDAAWAAGNALLYADCDGVNGKQPDSWST